jgi:hypothetical protein
MKSASSYRDPKEINKFPPFETNSSASFPPFSYEISIQLQGSKGNK